jgi:Uncharacterized conserved protein
VAEHLHQLLPRLRNLFYLEVNRENESDLLQLYDGIAEDYPELITARASAREDIYPLFRTLFSSEEIPSHV